MILGLLLIFIGLLILYVVFDFLIISGTDINAFGKKWIKKTLWIWLPIVALPRLVKEVVLKKK